MRPTDVVTGLLTTTMRTVLPQRGAIANARESVLRDRWTAAQRREATVVAARAVGHPSLLPPGLPLGVPDPGRPDGRRGGLALSLEERARVADVAPLAGFAAAAETGLDLLQDVARMDLWLVTAVQDGVERVVVARSVAGTPVPPGAVQPWAESYCRLMVAGEAPRVAPRVREVPAYAACRATKRWGIGAYVGVPLLDGDGDLFGTLCGLSATEQDDTLADALPEVERVARLLSTVLAKELAALERSQAAAQAYALAERDQLTGLLNRRGWHTRLTDEEERRRRRGHAASVLLLRLDAAAADEPDRPGEAGNDLLRRASRILGLVCRGADVVARLADHDFAVLALDCDGPDATRLARRLRDAFRLEGVPVTLGMASGGSHRDLLEAWHRADEQMHHLRRTTAPPDLASGGGPRH
jgi:diguanylate cyclase